MYSPIMNKKTTFLAERRSEKIPFLELTRVKFDDELLVDEWIDL